MNEVIAHCLRADTGADAIETVAQWWPAWIVTCKRHAQPIERAIASGFAADRVAWAFAGGYQAALRALLPTLPDGALVALCVTEETGNRPRDIQTTITLHADSSISISGAKRWTTLGPDSNVLLVVGRLVGSAGASAVGCAVGNDASDASGADSGRVQLKVARVPSNAPGLTLQAMPPTRFVPEVPHASVQLSDVCLPVTALLPGDGYDACVKPFRTIEDTHVSAAVLAYLLREARARGWPAPLRERIAATLTALAAIAAAEPDAAATHIALEGALQWTHQLYQEAAPLWAAAADEAAARWQRDSALFTVAGKARAQRAMRAWERVSQQQQGAQAHD